MPALNCTAEMLSPRVLLLHKLPREAPRQALRSRIARTYKTETRPLPHSVEPNIPSIDLRDALFATTLPPRWAGQLRPGQRLSLVDPSAHPLLEEEVESYEKLSTGNHEEKEGEILEEFEGDEQQQSILEDGETGTLEAHYDGLQQALREADTRKIYAYLTRLVSLPGSNDALTDILSKMPDTTFSELLRCLDPFVVSEALDGTRGIEVTANIAKTTHIGHAVSEFGIRKIYLKLLEGVSAIAEHRLAAGRTLQLCDYNILIRCAGAASDIQAAKRFWSHAKEGKYSPWRASDLYTEYVKARFLTDPLYSQNDLGRFRVRARDLHRSQLKYDEEALERLDDLRVRITRRRTHRFGQNPESQDYAEHIMRILRNAKPVWTMFQNVNERAQATSEEFFCAAMIAFGRTGSTEGIQYILRAAWQINLEIDPKTGEFDVGGGNIFPEDSLMRPTTRLLEAVTHSLCCQAEVSIALHLVDFISRRYGLEIPRHVWSDLLEWTYITATKPASLEWAIAGSPRKILKPDAVMTVWDTMLAEPYNFKPGIKEYNLQVKTLIEMNRFHEAVNLMRSVKATIYERLIQEQEEALFGATQALWQGVDCEAALARYHRAHAKKAHAWSCLHSWCSKILHRVRTKRHDDPKLVRIVPDLVREFWAFLPPVVQYRTAAGVVRFRTDNADLRSTSSPLHVDQAAIGFRPPNGTSPYGAYHSGEARPDLSLQRWLQKMPRWVSHNRHRRKRFRRPLDLTYAPYTVAQAKISLRWLAQQYT